MVFSGLFFITVFLPAVLILYYISKNRTYRNTVLIIMSLAFYAWGEPVFVLLLLLTSAFVYIIALLIQKNLGKPLSKIYLLSGISIV
ncbi:MAG TPA: MBOAT family protein, partial [Clostridia bacterium]|nr:MBOAT family protein [Clostridia bacterium]